MRFLNMGKWLSLVMIPVVLGLSGCEDNNLFGKLRGEGGDSTTLTSLAATALQEGNYSKALDLAERALAQDRNNSEAASIAADANIALAGLSIGDVVSNIVGRQSAGPTDIDDTLQRSRNHLSAQGTCGGTNSIMRNLDCDALATRATKTICLDKRIASGTMQGSVQPNQSGFLVKYAFHRLLRSVVTAILTGFIDIIRNGTDYDVTVDGNAATACTTSQSAVLTVIRDVAAVEAILTRVITIMGLSSNAVVSKIRADIDDVKTQILTQGGGQLLPAACYTLLDGAGITLATFDSVGTSEAFDPPTSTDC